MQKVSILTCSSISRPEPISCLLLLLPHPCLTRLMQIMQELLICGLLTIGSQVILTQTYSFLISIIALQQMEEIRKRTTLAVRTGIITDGGTVPFSILMMETVIL